MKNVLACFPLSIVYGMSVKNFRGEMVVRLAFAYKDNCKLTRQISSHFADSPIITFVDAEGERIGKVEVKINHALMLILALYRNL